jgi:hypothetical protein
VSPDFKPDDNRPTPLVFAARKGDLEIARLLIDKGADVNLTPSSCFPQLTNITSNPYYIGGPLHEADVRQGVDEVGRGPGHAALHRMRPELLRVLKLLEDRLGPADLHAAVGFAGGRVAQFAEARVPGARVVPAVRRLAGEFGRHLEPPDREPRIEPLEECAQARRHDPATDEYDVGRVGDGSGR